jgi:RNA polymerase sigma-70 factor (ECF subfamily)
VYEETPWIIDTHVEMQEDLEREFELRLADSSTLAFRVAYGVLRNREDAEDVAQEALAKAYRNYRKLRDRQRFRAWLVRITWRLAIDRQRADRRRFRREVVDLDQTTNGTAMEAILERERAAGLWKAIDALPKKLRLVTILAGIEEHNIRAVAQLLQVPEGTVKSRLHLARRRLKELLNE